MRYFYAVPCATSNLITFSIILLQVLPCFSVQVKMWITTSMENYHSLVAKKKHSYKCKKF